MIREAMLSSDNLDDIALYAGSGVVVIYDTKKVVDGKSYDAIIGALITTSSSIVDDAGKQVRIVEYVATIRKGLGPFLYDCAMKFFGPITHNNGPVSNDAWKIWNYYAKNRKELVTKVFSAEEAEQVFDEMDGQELNHKHVIIAGAAPDTTTLQSNHDEFVSSGNVSEKNLYRSAIDWLNDHV
jgi:hypothetical protein